MKVESLYIYPLKSARAQSVPVMKMTEQGPEGDRQWMLIDEEGKFVTQRTVPQLATVHVFNDTDSLTVGLGKMFFKISKQNNFQRRATVTVWNDSFEAALEPDLYSQGISQYLGKNVRLVRYAPYSARTVGADHSEAWTPEVQFADGRPLLLTNQASLDDLNSRLSHSVPMDRFRPNIVISGAPAFAEDQWQRIKIGEVIFSQPKRSSRCVMINIDQNSGESHGPEPLKTLASYRKDGTKVFFGSLWIPENAGLISAAAAIEVLA